MCSALSLLFVAGSLQRLPLRQLCKDYRFGPSAIPQAVWEVAGPGARHMPWLPTCCQGALGNRRGASPWQPAGCIIKCRIRFFCKCSSASSRDLPKHQICKEVRTEQSIAFIQDRKGGGREREETSIYIYPIYIYTMSVWYIHLYVWYNVCICYMYMLIFVYILVIII